MTDKAILKAAKDAAANLGWSLSRAIRVIVRMNQPDNPIKIEKSGQVMLF